MINRTKNKIRQLRQQPEEDRLRAASFWTYVLGIAIIIISLAILLPLQIYFR